MSEMLAGKRKHIVETAYALFKKQGYHMTGIDQIIAEAKVAKMTMYRHFPGKDGLILEVLDYRQDNFLNQLEDKIKAATDVRESISAIVTWYEGWFQSADFHGCVTTRALTEFPDLHHPVATTAARHKAILQERLTEILRAEMPSADAKKAAAALFLLLEGATISAQMRGVKEVISDLRQAVDAVLEYSGRRGRHNTDAS